MTRKEFIALVVSEIENIKQKATTEEINKLDFGTLNPEHINKCIYGQMTGDCASTRAGKLKQNIFEDIPTYKDTTTFEGFEQVKGNSFSALEAYILLIGAKNEEIIQYLKGEIDKLPEL